MAWPEDDERDREVTAALRAWARQVDAVPYPAGLDIDALVARHFADRKPELEPLTSLMVTTTADTAVVAVRGEIDLAGSGRLRRCLADELSLAPRALILDLELTNHCSARGLAVLLETAAAARQAGVPFAIVGCTAVVRRAVTALGLDTALPLHASTAEAVEWLDLLDRLKTLR